MNKENKFLCSFCRKVFDKVKSMTNHRRWHVHHKKALFTFCFVNPDGSTNLEEIKRAFAPENHQWMTIEEHRKLNHKRGRN